MYHLMMSVPTTADRVGLPLSYNRDIVKRLKYVPKK